LPTWKDQGQLLKFIKNYLKKQIFFLQRGLTFANGFPYRQYRDIPDAYQG
jgi:hypothetical protein